MDLVAGELAAWVRTGNGPAFLHAVTYRFTGHVSIDPGAYRDPKEVEAARNFDPILLARAALLAKGDSAASLDEIDAAAKEEIAAALQVAGDAPWPAPGEAYEDVMAQCR